MMTHEAALAEVERLRAIVDAYEAQDGEIEALIELWRQAREETEALVQRQTAQLAEARAEAAQLRAAVKIFEEQTEQWTKANVLYRQQAQADAERIAEYEMLLRDRNGEQPRH